MSSGRYLQPDPIGLEGGLNLYAYASSPPIHTRGELSTPPSLNKYLYAYANPYRWVDLDGYYVLPWNEKEETVLGLQSIGFGFDDTTGALRLPERQADRDKLGESIKEQRDIASALYSADSPEYKGWNNLLVLVTEEGAASVFSDENRHVKVDIRRSSSKDYPSSFPVVARVETEAEKGLSVLENEFRSHGLAKDRFFDVPMVPILSEDKARLSRIDMVNDSREQTEFRNRYFGRVLQGSQVGRGVGARVALDLGIAGLVLSSHDIQATRVAENMRLESVGDERAEMYAYLLKWQFNPEQVKYGKFISVKGFKRFKLGATIPYFPAGGAAINGELIINLDQLGNYE